MIRYLALNAVMLLALSIAAGAAQKPVVVVKGTLTIAAKGAEAGAVTTFYDSVTDCLRRAALDYEALTDEDVEQGKLAGAKVAIFAYSPNMSAAEAQAAAQFIQQGGKVIAFFSLPASLAQALGLEVLGYLGEQYDGQFSTCRTAPGVIEGMPNSFDQGSWNIVRVRPARPDAKVLCQWVDAAGKEIGEPALIISDSGMFMTHVLTESDRTAKTRLTLAVIGHYLPGVWEKAADSALAAIGQVGQVRNLDELSRLVQAATQAGHGRDAGEHVKQAQTLAGQADALRGQGKYAQAMDAAQQADDEAIQAYARAQQSRGSEFRAVWIHTAYGVKGWGWDRSIRHLKEMGFNAIVPNMWWAGLADYQSDFLPVRDRVKQEGDQIAACLAACRKYGVELHPWKVNWNLGNAPDDFVQKLREQGRLQASPSGEEIRWLCPSHPDNYQLEYDSMMEVVRKYDVDGVHFDYIRYPGSEGCYCNGCRARFEQRLGRKVEHWPDDVVKGDLREEYLQFRRDNITRLVANVSRDAHKLKPNIKISAAVFGDWPSSRVSIGQDTKLWIEQGYLDFVCPMNYIPNNDEFRSTIRAQVPATDGRIPLYCGIGSWLLKDGAQLIDQVNIARQEGADGFICFHYDTPDFTDKMAPALRAGITATDATTPHTAPPAAFDLPEGLAGLPPHTYAEGSKLTLAVTPAKDLPGEVAVELQRLNGEVVRQLGKAKAGQRATFEVGLPAGHYRLSASGQSQAAGGARFFMHKSRLLNVLSAEELRALQARNQPPTFTGQGVKVGVLQGCYGSSSILAALAAAEGVQAQPLYGLSREMLNACQVVIVPQPKGGVDIGKAEREALVAWVQQGGGLLVTHDMVGYRAHKALFPEVSAGGVALPQGTKWRAVAGHAIADGLKPGQDLPYTYYDAVALAKPEKGAVIATTLGGQPLVIAAEVGKGRYVANGMALGIAADSDANAAPTEAECKLLANAVRWLAAK